MTFTQAALLTSWLAIAVLTLGMAGLLRQVQQLSGAMMLRDRSAGGQGRADGHGHSSGVQGLALPASGPLSVLAPRGRAVLAVFVSPGCSSCAAVLDALSQRRGADVDTEVVVVSSGPCDASTLPTGARCVGDAMAVLSQLRVPGTPYLLSIDSSGTIGAGRLVTSRADVTTFFTPSSPTTTEVA